MGRVFEGGGGIGDEGGAEGRGAGGGADAGPVGDGAVGDVEAHEFGFEEAVLAGGAGIAVEGGGGGLAPVLFDGDGAAFGRPAAGEPCKFCQIGVGRLG